MFGISSKRTWVRRRRIREWRERVIGERIGDTEFENKA